MYQFNIAQEADGLYRFELNGINLIIDGFYKQDGKHFIQNPANAIAFFNINGNLYGISNKIITYETVEEFFETMCTQYAVFNPRDNNSIMASA